MDFIKSLRARTKSQSVGQQGEKHERLNETWGEDSEAIRDGVTFYVKYLGSILVDTPFGEEVASEAVKTIVCMTKTNPKKPEHVAVTVSLKGISMESITNTEHKINTSIYRVSHCSADGHYNQVFSYLSTNKNETIECHAFLCSKRKLAEAMALTVAKAFNMAFEIWEANRSKKKMAEALSQKDSKDEGLELAEQVEHIDLSPAVSEPPSSPEHDNKKTDLEGMIEFGLESPKADSDKAMLNDSGIPMSASKCDLISWSTVVEEEDLPKGEIGFEDDFVTLNRSFSIVAETPKHPLRAAKSMTKKVSAVDLKRLAAMEPLYARSNSPVRRDEQFFSRERHDSGSGITFQLGA